MTVPLGTFGDCITPGALAPPCSDLNGVTFLLEQYTPGSDCQWRAPLPEGMCSGIFSDPSVYYIGLFVVPLDEETCRIVLSFNFGGGLVWNWSKQVTGPPYWGFDSPLVLAFESGSGDYCVPVTTPNITITPDPV